nr:hypothetical protein [Tanacetum cinerariifolium]
MKQEAGPSGREPGYLIPYECLIVIQLKAEMMKALKLIDSVKLISKDEARGRAVGARAGVSKETPFPDRVSRN